MSAIDPREAKLPVWARKHIESLRRRVEDAESDRDAALLATDPAGSDTVLDAYAAIPVGLGKGTIVRFRLGDENRQEWVDVHVVRIHDGRRLLQVMAGTSIHIEPRATNVIHVEVSR